MKFAQKVYMPQEPQPVIGMDIPQTQPETSGEEYPL